MKSDAENGEFLTKSQFARLQGFSRPYITKLKDQGRLILHPDNPKLIHVARTVELLKATQDHARDATRARHQAARNKQPRAAEAHPAAPTQEPLMPPDVQPSGAAVAADADLSGAGSYWVAKAQRETALAKLAELDLAARQGELVARARVENAAYATSRQLRDSILGLPPRIAPELAVITDAFALEVALKTALRDVLEGFVKTSAQQLNAVLER